MNSNPQAQHNLAPFDDSDISICESFAKKKKMKFVLLLALLACVVAYSQQQTLDVHCEFPQVVGKWTFFMTENSFVAHYSIFLAFYSSLCE